MRRTDKTSAGILTELIRLFPKLSIEEQRMDTQLYRLLAGGTPVSRENITDALQLSNVTVNDYLNRINWIQYNEEGQIVAFRGLTLKPTSHRFEVDGKRLHTWCAFDTLFIPHLLDKTALVESVCPVTGHILRLRVGPKGVDKLDPKDAVISLVLPESTKAQENLIGNFCCHVHFFNSAQTGAKWASEGRGRVILSVDEAYDIALKMNRARYSDVLAKQI